MKLVIGLLTRRGHARLITNSIITAASNWNSSSFTSSFLLVWLICVYSAVPPKHSEWIHGAIVAATVAATAARFGCISSTTVNFLFAQICTVAARIEDTVSRWYTWSLQLIDATVAAIVAATIASYIHRLTDSICDDLTQTVIPLHWQIFIGHRPKNIGHHMKI